MTTFGQWGKYGRLYNLDAVEDKRSLAPDGCRVASSADLAGLSRSAQRPD